MKTIYLLLLFCFSLSVNGQIFNQYYSDIVDAASYEDYYNNLLAFEEFGAKGLGDPGLDNTAQWIINYYENIGYEDIVVDTFDYNGHEMYNIIITKEGTDYPETYFIIDGHYDTVHNCGTDDNGTGTCSLLEVAKLLKDVKNKVSIKFIHFTGEEIGFVGSRRYVDSVVIPTNMDIKLLLNIDMVGGDAQKINDIIICERDEDGQNGNDYLSALYCDTLVNLVEMYTDLDTEIDRAYGSDYVPFMQNGEIVLGFFEYNWNPYYHTQNDLLVNMDPEYAFEVVKAATAATLYFSETYTDTSQINQVDNEIIVYPNPFNGILYILTHNDCLMNITDITGRLLINDYKLKSGFNKLEVNMLNRSIYFIQIVDNQGNVLATKKAVKE